MKYQYNLNIIDKSVCKIVVELEGRKDHGSGVIFQNGQNEKIYIITAKHCILGKEFKYNRDEINITVFINEDIKYREINLDSDDEIIYDSNNLNDRAIIILDKKKYKILETGEGIGLLNIESVSNDCFFRGYPAPYNINDEIKGVNINICRFIENNIITSMKNCINDDYPDAKYNISGCSGGGVFIIHNKKLYLVSIAYEFESLFERVKVMNISGFNNLLSRRNLPLLSFDEYYEEKDIPLSKLEEQYSKAKKGWLKEKYIPDLHMSGEIEKISENIVQSNEFILKVIEILLKYKKEICKILNELKYNAKDCRLNNVKEKIEKFITYLELLNKNIDKVILNIRNDSMEDLEINLDEEFHLSVLIRELKVIEDSNFQFRNVRILRKSLENMELHNIRNDILRICEVYNKKYLVFLGEPGTGKTHALANIVEKNLQERVPSIVIQAKKYDDFNSWKDILINVLGLSNSLSEDDIWDALEETASILDINKKSIKDELDKEINIKSRVIICIDGIDEAISKTNWIERIREIEVICRKYKRLRFIISSRPYCFSDIELNGKWNISKNGDIAVHKIFDYYVDNYDVKFEDKGLRKRIKWSIKTPLELRLFCEKYSKKEIKNNEKINKTISSLLSEKIIRIDNEINLKLNNYWTESDNMVKNILINIVSFYIEESRYEISHEEILDILLKSSKVKISDSLIISKLIDLLVDYGLLYRRVEEAEEFLEDDKIYYEITIQPLIDYIIAIKVKSLYKEGNKDFPQILYDRIDAQKLFSLMILEENNILVGTENLWNNYYDIENLVKVQAFALANVSINLAENYRKHINNLIKKNTKTFRLLVNNLIADVSRIPNHPLGAEFLHDILMSYKTPADRDVIWSVPENMNYKNNEIWEGSSKCIYSVKGLELCEGDMFNGLPLIYAWNLTNVDNDVRRKVREELTKWGINNQDEFCKLLDKTFETNDPQMKEDLMACLLGIVSSYKLSDENLKVLANWVLKNIFDERLIQRNKSVVIRFVGRIIIEQAFKKN
ncbi:hypothetical protein CYK67_07175 [Clostridium perfringens]|nr:hypothetical protein CYK67_07175 [Clostridium perfringens]